MKFFLRTILFFFLGVYQTFAQLSLPDIFTNDMVFQRDRPIHLWGKSIPGTPLEVQFGSETISSTVRQDSTWTILIKKRKANSESQSIQITSGQQKIV